MTNATGSRLWAGAAMLTAALLLGGCGKGGSSAQEPSEQDQQQQASAQEREAPRQQTPPAQQRTQQAAPPAQPHEQQAQQAQQVERTAPPQAEAQPASAAAGDPHSDPEALVARYMQLLGEGKFEDVVPLLYENSDGYQRYLDSLDGMQRARQAVGEEVYEQVRQRLSQSVRSLTWKVVRVSEDRAVVGYKGPRDDDPEQQFEVRLVKGRWLVVPPPGGMPMGR